MKYQLILLCTLALSLMGCDRINKDLANAPNDIKRYGLADIKLGESKKNTLAFFKQLSGKSLECKHSKAGLGSLKRTFSFDKCVSEPLKNKAKLWEETLTGFSANFLDDQLVELSFTLQTTGNYEELYNKHGKRIIQLFGKPETITEDGIIWRHKSDAATLKPESKNTLHFHIENYKVMKLTKHY